MKGTVLLCHPAPVTNSPIRATCVDARGDARRIFWSGGARRQVLPCVRPHVYGLICGSSHAAGPDGVRGSGPIQSHALEAPCCTLVFLIPSHRPLRHPSPSTFLRPNSPTDAS